MRSFSGRGADGVPVADICRKAGINISQATYFNWKKKYVKACSRLRCAG